MNTVLDRLLWLDKTIKHHAKLYYEQDRSEISDAEYDGLLFEYNNLVNQFPELIKELKEEIEGPLLGTTASPSSLEDTKLSVVPLTPPMLSLANALSIEAYKQWKEKLPEGVTLAEEYKLDGLAVRLIYVNGDLERIVTRGTGLEGEDITTSLKLIKNIPESIPNPTDDGSEIIIDGELVISKADFEVLNELVTKPYVHPRHAASGLARTLNPDDQFCNTLEFFSYGMPRVKDYDYTRVIKELRLLGFQTTADFSVNPNWEERPNLPYAVDGIVVKVIDPEDREAIGNTSHHPKWAIAYKFPKLTGTSKLKDCVWQVGRSGSVTPVVLFNPVNIGGSSITRASVHNFRRFQLQAEGLKVGADITVGLSGDIIPELISVDSYGKGKQLTPPKVCPSCETPLTFNGTNDDQVFLVCENHEGCPAQISRRLIHFASKRGMNIKGIGKVKINQWVESGVIRNFTDLLSLDERFPNDITLVDALAKAKTVKVNQFIYALGIPGVGSSLSKTIGNVIEMDNFFGLLTNKDQLVELPDIDWGTAIEIVNYVKNNEVDIRNAMNKITLLFEFIAAECTVVLTGNFGGDRSLLKERLLAHGIDVASRVTKKTKAVFLGDRYTKHKEKTALDLEIPLYQLNGVDYNRIVDTIVSYVK